MMAIRRERVILDLQDDFTPGMARAVAAAALLNRELNSLSGNSVKASQAFSRDIQRVGRDADGAGRSIDRLSGRVGILFDLLLTLGPAAIPIGAVAVPAVTALSAGLGFAVVAAGSAVIAFQGVGDALDTLNKAQLDPTTANIEAAELAMKRISPVARDMVKQLDALGGLGKQLRDAGAESLFPDLIKALDIIVERGPEVERIIRAVNAELGDIAADTATSLNSKRWDDFFRMVETEAPDALDAMADSLGNVTHGLSEIIEAFVPLNRDGMAWLVDATDGFDKWATGLKKTEGFKDFVAYVRENGPQVAETVGALATALVDVIEAAAPLGGPALQALEAVAKAVSAIADSEFATPLLAGIAAMRTINRLAPATAASMAMLGGGAAGGKGGKGRGRMGGLGMNAAIVGGAVGIPWLDDLFKGNSITDAVGNSGKNLGDKLGIPDVFSVKVDLDTKLAENKVGFLLKEARSLTDAFGRPVLDLDDKSAKQKQREADDWILNWGRQNAAAKADVLDVSRRKKSNAADDWINAWGRRNAAAKADILDVSRRKKSREADDWILNWGRKRGEAEADVDASSALATLMGVTAGLNALDGKTATTYINTVRTITGPKGGAAFSQNAFGDVKDRHDPQIAEGGEWRVWAEPETQGESYIPHANDSRRPRARQILEDTAAILGARSVEWYATGGTKESDAQKKARERAEEARRRAEERRQREEERRLRQLDKQRTKDLLKSNLRDEQEQARLEVQDARRRLRSAREADRPKAEVREARLALKGERSDIKDMRANALQERQQKLVDAREERERKQAEAREKHDAEVQQRVDAILDGQSRAWDIVTDSARSNVDAAKSVLDGVNASMEQIGKAATAAFQSNWFTGGGQQQHGLWVGANVGPEGDWRSQALNDIRGLEERKGLIGQLSGQGLTGAALENLLANQSNAGISAMLQGGQIGDYAALFAQRESLTSQTAAAAGQAGFGGAQAAATAALTQANATIAALTAAIEAARQNNFTIIESVSAAATAAEVARLQATYGVS